MGTIQTIRPSSVYTGGSGFTATGAGSLQAAMNDSSDASTIKKNAVSGQRTVGFNLGTYSIPAGMRISRFRIGLRVSAPAGARYGVRGRLYDRWTDTAIEVERRWTAQYGSATTVYTGWVEVASAYAGIYNFSAQHAVDDADLAVTEYRDGADRATFYEVFIELDVLDKPTVTVDAVPTNTSKPTVSWVYDDGDGDPQSRVQVAVFDSATYSASGFTPSSGWIGGFTWKDDSAAGPSVAAVQVDTALANGTTYRAYVRVHHYGAEWSDWAYAQWTVAVSPPAQPSLAATYAAATNAVTVTCQGHTNMLSLDNAQAETTVGDWTGLTNIAATWPKRSTAYASEGAASVEMKANGAGTMAVIVGAAGRVPVTAGTTYSVMADVRAPAAGSARAVRVGIRWMTAAGATVADVYSAAGNDATGAWTTYSYVAVAPATAVLAAPIVEVASAAANELHYVDKAAIYPGQPDGSVNLLPNPSFETDTAGWGASAFGWTAGTLAQSAVRAQHGTKSGLVTLPTDGSGLCGVQCSNALVIGASYTFSVYVWVPTGVVSFKVLDIYGTGTTNVTYGVQSTGATKDAWVRLSMSFEAAATTAYLGVKAEGATTAGQQIWVDAAQTQAGRTLTAFTPPAPAAWTVGGYTEHVGIVDRSDDGGGTWQQVRGPVTMDGNQLATFTDYEAPRGGTVLYRAHAEAVAGGLVNGSSYPANVSVAVTNDGRWWVKAVLDPAVNVGGARIIADPTAIVEETVGVWRPLGADFALTTTGDLYGEDPEFTWDATGQAEVDAVAAAVKHRGILLLQSPFAVPDRYIKLTGRSVVLTGTPAAPRSRWALTAVQTDRPPVVA